MAEGENVDGRKKVKIKVNRQDVDMAGARHSGLEIKDSAIAQGVAIQPSFQLSIRGDTGKFKVVGDGEVIDVKDGDVFRAVASDDNS